MHFSSRILQPTPSIVKLKWLEIIFKNKYNHPVDFSLWLHDCDTLKNYECDLILKTLDAT